MGKQKNLLEGSKSYYDYFSFFFIVVLGFLFIFPLYWIIAGAFKTGQEINSATPVWIPSE